MATDLTLPFRKTQPTDGAPLIQISHSNTSGGTAMYILANSSGAATAIRGASTTGTAGRFITTSATAGTFISTTDKAIFTDGDIKFTGIGETNKAVLTSDANGNATWSSRCFYKASGFLSDHHAEPQDIYTLVDWQTEEINLNNNAVLDNASGKLFVLKTGLYRININISYFTKNSSVK